MHHLSSLADCGCVSNPMDDSLNLGKKHKDRKTAEFEFSSSENPKSLSTSACCFFSWSCSSTCPSSNLSLSVTFSLTNITHSSYKCLLFFIK